MFALVVGSVCCEARHYWPDLLYSRLKAGKKSSIHRDASIKATGLVGKRIWPIRIALVAR